MPQQQSHERPRIGCYHEAGHCLARWYFGRQSDWGVVLTRAGGRQDATIENCHASMQAETLASVEVALAELYAGSAAEARHRRMSFIAVAVTGSGEDHSRGEKLLDVWFPKPAARKATALLAERRALALVRSTVGWAAITTMAKHLQAHGELSWDKGNVFCEKTFGWSWSSRRYASQSDLPSVEDIRCGLKPRAPLRRRMAN